MIKTDAEVRKKNRLIRAKKNYALLSLTYLGKRTHYYETSNPSTDCRSVPTAGHRDGFSTSPADETSPHDYAVARHNDVNEVIGENGIVRV